MLATFEAVCLNSSLYFEKFDCFAHQFSLQEHAFCLLQVCLQLIAWNWTIRGTEMYNSELKLFARELLIWAICVVVSGKQTMKNGTFSWILYHLISPDSFQMSYLITRSSGSFIRSEVCLVPEKRVYDLINYFGWNWMNNNFTHAYIICLYTDSRPQVKLSTLFHRPSLLDWSGCPMITLLVVSIGLVYSRTGPSSLSVSSNIIGLYSWSFIWGTQLAHHCMTSY